MHCTACYSAPVKRTLKAHVHIFPGRLMLSGRSVMIGCLKVAVSQLVAVVIELSPSMY